jgi:hypothetical protein
VAKPLAKPPIGTPRFGIPVTLGSTAAARWLGERGLASHKAWYVEISLDVVDAPASAVYSGNTASRLHLSIYPEEWGLMFCHGGRTSWIRVTDQPFVHGRDDFDLLAVAPPLDAIGKLVRQLESEHAIKLQRAHALIRTNIAGGKAIIRSWLTSL